MNFLFRYVFVDLAVMLYKQIRIYFDNKSRAQREAMALKSYSDVVDDPNVSLEEKKRLFENVLNSVDAANNPWLSKQPDKTIIVSKPDKPVSG